MLPRVEFLRFCPILPAPASGAWPADTRLETRNLSKISYPNGSEQLKDGAYPSRSDGIWSFYIFSCFCLIVAPAPASVGSPRSVSN